MCFAYVSKATDCDGFLHSSFLFPVLLDYADQEIKPRVLPRLDKHSSIELHSQAVLILLYVINFEWNCWAICSTADSQIINTKYLYSYLYSTMFMHICRTDVQLSLYLYFWFFIILFLHADQSFLFLLSSQSYPPTSPPSHPFLLLCFSSDMVDLPWILACCGTTICSETR